MAGAHPWAGALSDAVDQFHIATPHEAWDLQEFLDALKKISIHSLYHHIFEGRIRPPLGINDFSNWLENGLGETRLAKAIHSMDPILRPWMD